MCGEFQKGTLPHADVSFKNQQFCPPTNGDMMSTTPLISIPSIPFSTTGGFGDSGGMGVLPDFSFLPNCHGFPNLLASQELEKSNPSSTMTGAVGQLPAIPTPFLDSKLHLSDCQMLSNQQAGEGREALVANSDMLPVQAIPPARFRSHQAENWMEKFEELLDFRLKHGHCLVPNAFKENPSLAEWVKRQRYQFKLKRLGHHSNMSDDRIAALEKLGFVWNSHDQVWEERLKELKAYKAEFNDCHVPSSFAPNPQLAIWVKVRS